MRNHHHIFIPDCPKRVIAELCEMGIIVDRIVAFGIYEDDSRWPRISELVKQYKGFDSCESRYTHGELCNAALLKMFCTWHWEYPQPDGAFDAAHYIGKTYDLTNYCFKCGTGAKQNAPFYIRKAPAWGRRSMLMLNWVSDAFFVPHNIWENVFAPLGIEYWPVLYIRNAKEVANIVQLKIDDTLDAPLDMSTFPAADKCPTCGRYRYNYDITYGCFPSPVKAPSPHKHIYHTQEYFGGGIGTPSAKITIISQALYQAMHQHDIKPLFLLPLKQLSSNTDPTGAI